ncbi:MAG: pyridoxine/pyridoxamine 5-phosphate oxidase 1, chloroplastic isoform [Bacteroidota bacterium]|nr:pyridoxine/pyridoxamine 5-phosphate oxidase 1, chloroplastic isoform [Bacteroidota bacterium]
MPSKDLSNHRRNYVKHELTEDKISPNPYEQFGWWFEDVTKSEMIEPNAMVLATASKSGSPSARMVLLKSFDENGYMFYTNYHSRKGKDISENNQGALLFYWDVLERQVRVEGTIEKIDVTLSEQYFSNRPYESRLSAIVSEQSEEIPSRQFLEDKFEEVRNAGVVQRPLHWGGYVLKANYFEFWQGRASRLHDRIVYVLENGAWKIKRLAP